MMNTTFVTPHDAGAKAHTLTEALPYIRNYRGETVVVKIGGAALDDARLAEIVAEDLALLNFVGIRLVLVHGGGPQVSRAIAELGVESRFVGGLRVTDDVSMEVVRRVLVGSINADLVTRLTRAGVRAVGLAGSDGGLLRAERIVGPAGEELGRVGRIDAVDDDLVTSLLGAGYTPVIASVAPAVDGTPLNINADAVAGAVAAAVDAVKLVYLTNVSGLYRDFGMQDTVVPELQVDELRALIPSLSDGMRPKAFSAVEALDAGVNKVHVLDGRVEHALLLEIFTDEGIGTQVLP
jgi:acetylglutamate kinase